MALGIPPAVAELLGMDGVEQTWKDRIREAAYTSPSKTRIKFDYESVSREFDKRTTAFDFRGVNNSYVQQNGSGSRRYPMRCIFWGANHDLVATAFEAALLEDGVGVLEHPLYGTINVVPFGTVTRRDDPKGEANQTIVELTFWTTLGAVYPQAQAHAESEILSALAGFDVEAAQQFADSTDLIGALKKASAKNTFRKLMREFAAQFERMTTAVASVRQEMADVQSSINLGLDVLIGQPLQLALQITNLARFPARALGGVLSRLESYDALLRRIINSAAGIPGEWLALGQAIAPRRERIANDFHAASLFAMASVAGAALSVAQADAGFTTRTEALAAADALLTQFEDLIAWREEGFAALGEIEELGAFQVDSGGAYQALQAAVALTAGYLIELSFSLGREQVVELERDTTIINAAAELYGEVDAKLDFLIATNDLTGSEILELPKGRRLVYYPT